MIQTFFDKSLYKCFSYKPIVHCVGIDGVLLFGIVHDAGMYCVGDWHIDLFESLDDVVLGCCSIGGRLFRVCVIAGKDGLCSVFSFEYLSEYCFSENKFSDCFDICEYKYWPFGVVQYSYEVSSLELYEYRGQCLSFAMLFLINLLQYDVPYFGVNLVESFDTWLTYVMHFADTIRFNFNKQLCTELCDVNVAERVVQLLHNGYAVMCDVFSGSCILCTDDTWMKLDADHELIFLELDDGILCVDASGMRYVTYEDICVMFGDNDGVCHMLAGVHVGEGLESCMSLVMDAVSIARCIYDMDVESAIRPKDGKIAQTSSDDITLEDFGERFHIDLASNLFVFRVRSFCDRHLMDFENSKWIHVRVHNDEAESLQMCDFSRIPQEVVSLSTRNMNPVESSVNIEDEDVNSQYNDSQFGA